MAQPSVPEVHVQLLGPLRLHVDGVQIDTNSWKSKKALVLFKYLVSRGGERSPKDVLIELLWPDCDDIDRTTHNLHTVIYYLRRELEPHLARYEQPRLLRHSAGLYWFQRGPGVRVDVDEFLESTRSADQLYATDAAAALQHYRQALQLYKDDFSPEDLYEDWATTVREQLRERYITAVMRASELIDRLEDDRLYAIRICRKALQREPFREELHRMLIMHLIKAGFHAEAAGQYRECERMLEDEFGLRPSPATVALYEQLNKVRDRHLSDERERTHHPDAASLTLSGYSSGLPSRSQQSSLPAQRATQAVNAAGTPTEDSLGIFAGPVDKEEESLEGPLICDRPTYAFLHRLELRRQARTGRPVTLLRITLGAGVDVDAAERALCVRVLKSLLRAGDVFCWETPTQLLVQLPSTGAQGARAVQARVQHGLEQVGLLFFETRFSVIEGEDTTTANVGLIVDGGASAATDASEFGVVVSEQIQPDGKTRRSENAPGPLSRQATG